MRPSLVALAVPALLAIGFVLVLAASPHGAFAKSNPIDVGNLYFCTAADQDHVCETDVTAGDSVTWTVVGGSHTVTECTDATFNACSGGFDSGTLQQAGTFTRTFDAPGAIYYHCAFHPSEMMGKIVVAAAPTPTASATASGTPVPTAAPALPAGGGPPGNGGAGVWEYAVLALGGALLAGSVLSFAVARRR